MALSYVWSLKWSLAAAVASLALSILSFGMLGYVLYYLAYPVVGSIFPPLPSWRPDAVWPLIVAAGMLWSLSFLPAGIVDRELSTRGTPGLRRKLSYLAILWFGAVAAWLILLAVDTPPLRLQPV
jgi:hypothetical protein